MMGNKKSKLLVGVVFLSLILLLGLFVMGFYVFKKQQSSLTLDELKNATYLNRYAEEAVSLKDGVYASSSKNQFNSSLPVITYRLDLDNDKVVFGDLDHDGLEDAMVVLRENTDFGRVIGYTTTPNGDGSVSKQANYRPDTYKLVAMLNKKGKPFFADMADFAFNKITSVSFESDDVIKVVAIDHRTKGTIVREYKFKDNYLTSVTFGEILTDIGGGLKRFDLLDDLVFNVPDSFTVEPFSADTKSVMFRTGYPTVGQIGFICMLNNQVPPMEYEKIIRTHSQSGVRICVSGSNYADYPSEYPESVNGVPINASYTPWTKGAYKSGYIEVKVDPTPKNHGTTNVRISVSTLDENNVDEAKRIFSVIKESIKLKQ